MGEQFGKHWSRRDTLLYNLALDDNSCLKVKRQTFWQTFEGSKQIFLWRGQERMPAIQICLSFHNDNSVKIANFLSVQLSDLCFISIGNRPRIRKCQNKVISLAYTTNRAGQKLFPPLTELKNYFPSSPSFIRIYHFKILKAQNSSSGAGFGRGIHFIKLVCRYNRI